MKKFDFDKVAGIYDDYYNTDLGIQVDLAEKRKLKQFIKQLECPKILEIGCGTGHWTTFFSEQGLEVAGIDVSEKMIEKAKTKKIPNADFSIASVEKLPFETKSIDNIIAITSMEFVNNLDLAFREIFRVLKTGGKLLIGCLNLNSSIGQTKDDVEMFSTAHFFTADNLKEKLSDFGNPILDACCIINENKVLDTEEDINTLEIRLNQGCLLIGMVTKL